LPPVRRSEVVNDVHVSSGRVIDNLKALLSSGLRRTTITAWVYWFVAIFTYYGFFTWIPSLLVNQGFDISKSFLSSIVIYLAQIPGYYSAAFVSEWLERKWTIAIYRTPREGAVPGAVLRSVTTVAAELLRREAELSVLVPGAVGDVVLTRGNPLRDIDVLAKPESGVVAVIQEGTVRARR